MVPVVVIASDGDMRETLRDVLEAEGYPVTATGDGQEAMAHMERSDTPLVVVAEEDEYRPGFTTTQLVEIALQGEAQRSRREVVLLTDRPNAVPAALQARVLVLAEPLNLDMLLEAVAQAVARLEER